MQLPVLVVPPPAHAHTDDYVALLRTIFDIEALKALFARPDFKFVYDSMHGGRKALVQSGLPFTHARCAVRALLQLRARMRAQCLLTCLARSQSHA